MYTNLCGWMFRGGDKLSLAEIVELARATGYEGIEIPLAIREEIVRLVEEKSIDYVKDLFSSAKIIPAGWQLPESWRGSEVEYQQLLKKLPLFAKIGQSLDCRRVFTFIHSFSDKMDYQENFQWHVKRFRPVARILKGFNCRLGLEWMGPKTLRVGPKYEFIHDMEKMLELIKEIDEDNVGLLLDTWHWYTSYGTLDALRKLKAEQVVYVHFVDAPAGVPVDEQLDMVRAIPGETGVIDLVGFLKFLKEIGYDGPVEPSVTPGTESIKNMSVRQAAQVCCDAQVKLFQKAGIIEK